MNTKERTLLAKRLSFLVKAGVPLLECLHIVRAQASSLRQQKFFDGVIADIENGSSFAASLSERGNPLGDFAAQVIHAGEVSGTLSHNLSYLADELYKRHLLKRKIISALIYPLCITVAMLGLTAMLVVFIFPKIMPIFATLHVELPLSTLFLLAVSSYLERWGIVTLLAALALVGIFLFLRRRVVRVRYYSDVLLLKLPFVGAMVRSYNLAGISRTLALLLRSASPVLEACELTARTSSNLVYRRACREVARGVSRGEPISRQLSRSKRLFPDMFAHLVAVGEETGNLAQSLSYLSDFYEGEVDELAKNFSSSLEPALMIVMGLLVGLVAVSVISPIYEITQHIQPR